MSTYVRPNDVIDVRLEPWYERYLQAIETLIENISSKKSFIAHGGKIKLVGIEGCPMFGKRTRDEWTALIEDLDRGVRGDTALCRPSSSRVPLDELEEALEWSRNKEYRYVIVASCPNRLGDNMAVMDQVKVMCGEYDNVFVGFSSAGNLASTLYANSTSPRGGGGAAEDLAAGVAAIAVSTPRVEVRRVWGAFPPGRGEGQGGAGARRGRQQAPLLLCPLSAPPTSSSSPPCSSAPLRRSPIRAGPSTWAR